MSLESWRESIQAVARILLSSVSEKNPVKAWAVESPVVLSAGRLVIVSLVVAVIWYVVETEPTWNWPLAFTVAALAFALPVTAKLQRVKPREALEWFRSVAGELTKGRG